MVSILYAILSEVVAVVIINDRGIFLVIPAEVIIIDIMILGGIFNNLSRSDFKYIIALETNFLVILAE